MLWIALGVLAVLFVRNQFDVQGVKRDVRKIARGVRNIVRDLAEAVRQMVRDAKKETGEARKAAPEKEIRVSEAQPAQPVQAAAPQESEPRTDPDLQFRTAVMLAEIPTLDFPKDDPKYDSSRKYNYA